MEKKTVSLRDLPPAEAYNVACALRGPDAIDAEPLKTVTTSVLRSFVEEAIRSQEALDECIDTFHPVIVAPEEVMRSADATVARDWGTVRKLADANVHFMLHFWVGLYTLGRILPEAREYAVWLRNRIGDPLGMGEPLPTRESPRGKAAVRMFP